MLEVGYDFARAAERLAKYRDRVAGMREHARQRSASGARGIHILAGLSESTDELIVEIFQDNIAAYPRETRALLESETAIIAVGGSGRGERAPYSDVDLLFVHQRGMREPFQECIAAVVRDCWDAGLQLGHSVRTPEDTIAMSLREPQFATAMIEARLIWGSEKLTERLKKRFYNRVVRRRVAGFIDDCVSARAGEYQEHGATVQQLEPDLKRSAGGLRDLHLIRWVGFARYGTADFGLLRLQGALTREETQTLLAGQEFLSHVRVELHLGAGKPQELLTRDEQLRIAESFRFEGTPGQSPVERFMQQYFRHTTAISDIARRFVSLNRPRSLLSRVVRFVMTHRANRIFRVSPDEIDVVPRYRETVSSDPQRLLGMYELASLYRVTPTPEFEATTKLAVAEMTAPLSPSCPGLFLSILSRGKHLGRVLRSMYDVGILEKLVPEFSHARCLLQFNQYHSYTVDEHSLRAVEAAAAFESDTGRIGRAYREIHRKDILHLALLLHDLGKGFDEDHSEVGRRIAEQVADRFLLSNHWKEVLSLLVHKHLVMANLAFRRNTSDRDVLLRFSRDVGSPEILRMLYVLTAADITAVGPGVWTNWKAELLTELYDRSMLELNGETNLARDALRLQRVREDVVGVLCHPPNMEGRLSRESVLETLDTFPTSLLLSASTEQIAAAVRAIHNLGPDEVIVTSEFDATMNVIEHRVITHDHIGFGCFSKIAGVLTAKRLEILSAAITTTTDGIVLDSFRVVDSDFAGPVPTSRLEEVETAIKDVLMGRKTPVNLFQSNRRFQTPGNNTFSDLPTRVMIDNDSSANHTVIDVFAHDKMGLLYTIACVLRDLGLSVALAKIATHLDQVVDVFYVTDQDGRKIKDSARLDLIRDTLVSQIEDFEHPTR